MVKKSVFIVLFYISWIHLFASESVYIQKGRYFNWTPQQIQETQYKIKPLGLGTQLYGYNQGLLTMLSTADTVLTSYLDFEQKVIDLLSAGYQDSDVFSGTPRYIVKITLQGDGTYIYHHHEDRNVDVDDPIQQSFISTNTQDYISQYYFALTPVLFDESMVPNYVPESINRIVIDSWSNSGLTTIIGERLTVIQTNGSGFKYRRSDGSIIWSNSDQFANKTIPDDGIIPDIPHEDNGFHTGESFGYVLNPGGQPVMVGLKFTIELELFRKEGGSQIYGERKNPVTFTEGRIWANPYDLDSWLRKENDWFQLNSFSVGSARIDIINHNSWSNTSKQFEIGDTIAENETYVCTFGFNKVPIQNPRTYGPTYYDYTYVDVYLPITWSLE